MLCVLLYAYGCQLPDHHVRGQARKDDRSTSARGDLSTVRKVEFTKDEYVYRDIARNAGVGSATLQRRCCDIFVLLISELGFPLLRDANMGSRY